MTKIEFIKSAAIAAMQSYIEKNGTEEKELSCSEIAKKSVNMAILLENEIQRVIWSLF